MRQIIRVCKEKNYLCFLTNPCFEFWLLLRLCDIAEEYSSHLDELLRNKRVSSRHTFISFEVSKRARHAKGINEKVFLAYYLPNVDKAIERAEKFTGSTSLLLDRLGTNIPELFRILRSDI